MNQPSLGIKLVNLSKFIFCSFYIFLYSTTLCIAEDPSLTSIILGGDFERAKKLISRDKNNVNIDSDGFTPLTSTLTAFHSYQAADEKNTLKFIEYLIEQGADVDQRDKAQGWTPLMYATKKSFIEILLIKGADKNAKDTIGNSVLSVAAAMDNEELMRAIRPEPGLDNIELVRASSQNDVDRIKKILSSGIGANDKVAYGFTPLINAATHGHLEASKILVSAGADPNMRSEGSGSPTEIAYQYGHSKLLAYFTENGGILSDDTKQKLLERMLVGGLRDVHFDVSDKSYSVDLAMDVYGYLPLNKKRLNLLTKIHMQAISIFSRYGEAEVNKSETQKSIEQEILKYCNEELNMRNVFKVVIRKVKTSKTPFK